MAKRIEAGRIVAGLGFRAAVRSESLSDAFMRASAGRKVHALVTAKAKSAAPALLAFARARGLRVIAVDSATLAAQHTPTQSASARAAYGTGSVAEAAALAAAGPEGRLLGPRLVSGDRMATCALALWDGERDDA